MVSGGKLVFIYCKILKFIMSFFGAQLRQVNLIFISIELLWLYWSVLRYMQSLNKDFFVARLFTRNYGIFLSFLSKTKLGKLRCELTERKKTCTPVECGSLRFFSSIYFVELHKNFDFLYRKNVVQTLERQIHPNVCSLRRKKRNLC